MNIRMNIRGGWALIRKEMFTWMAHRGFHWTLTFGWMMGPLIYLFVWSVAARQGPRGGFGRDDFVFYYLCVILVNQFTYPVCNWTVGDSIRNGTFSTWLLHPLPPIYEPIGGDIAMKMACTPFGLAVTILLGVILRPRVSVSFPAVVGFALTLLLAQILRFLWAYVMALLAFWIERADALLGLNDSLVFLFAGQVAPIALMPGVLKQIAIMLPYRYMIGFPIELLMGRLGRGEIWVGLCWQIGWLAVTLFLYRLVWRRGVRHYTAVGG